MNPATLSPKDRFLQSDPRVLAEFRDILVSDTYIRACDFALLEYQRMLAIVADNGDSAASHQRIAGAIQFLEVLQNLAEKPAPYSRPASANLNHKV